MRTRTPAGGVRLVHNNPAMAGQIVVVPTFRRYATPRLCSTCKVAHDTKHYHLHLDGQASVIVSHRIYHRLREIGMAGFELESQVKDPPALQVSNRMPTSKRQIALMSDALKGLTPPGVRVTVTNGGKNRG